MKIYLSIVLKLSLLVATVACASAAQAQNANRPLPVFQLQDANGVVLTTDLLRMPNNWVLVLVNPGLSNTRSVLQSLVGKDAEIGSEITILVLGDAKELSAAIADNSKLAGARWYRAELSAVKQQLNVSGFPIFLGITPAQQIRWQQSGQPRAADQLTSMIRSWTAPTAAAQ